MAGLLGEIARRLARTMPRADTVARPGGDEFGLVAANPDPGRSSDQPPYEPWSNDIIVDALPPPIGPPLESANPISMCGPVEIPTIPGPIELIT